MMLDEMVCNEWIAGGVTETLTGIRMTIRCKRVADLTFVYEVEKDTYRQVEHRFCLQHASEAADRRGLSLEYQHLLFETVGAVSASA